MTRLRVVDRRLPQMIDRAGPVLNRDAAITAEILKAVLDTPCVPGGDCRRPWWAMDYIEIDPTLEACQAFLRTVTGFVHAGEPWRPMVKASA